MRLDLATLLLLVSALTGCGSGRLPPLTVVPYVDLQRFMGDWYVIANIPTWIEQGAHNAVESYRLNPNGTVATTFTFRAGSFDGPLKRYEPTGFVYDTQSNAVWGMQFVWPIKADYRVVYLSPDYGVTVIGREARDYVWIMARKPDLPEQDYRRLIDLLAEEGYAVGKIQRVPQHWTKPR